MPQPVHRTRRTCSSRPHELHARIQILRSGEGISETLLEEGEKALPGEKASPGEGSAVLLGEGSSRAALAGASAWRALVFGRVVCVHASSSRSWAGRLAPFLAAGVSMGEEASDASDWSTSKRSSTLRQAAQAGEPAQHGAGSCGAPSRGKAIKEKGGFVRWWRSPLEAGGLAELECRVGGHYSRGARKRSGICGGRMRARARTRG